MISVLIDEKNLIIIFKKFHQNYDKVKIMEKTVWLN